jgi:nucleotide-binding universal stress UspA family protein
MTPDIKRILVPLDFSANSSRALEYALGLARKFGASIHLVQACPVLTVREPREREALKGVVKKIAFAGALLIAVLLWPAVASAQEMKQTTPGGETFRTYCATCHGTSARGDGPLAASMRRKPANLTEIAKRNGGVFATELVFKTIDGRQPVRGHGGPDMPAWGDAFGKSREAGDEERVKSLIQALVDYLESIQLRPAHDRQQ